MTAPHPSCGSRRSSHRTRFSRAPARVPHGSFPSRSRSSIFHRGEHLPHPGVQPRDPVFLFYISLPVLSFISRVDRVRAVRHRAAHHVFVAEPDHAFRGFVARDPETEHAGSLLDRARDGVRRIHAGSVPVKNKQLKRSFFHSAPGSVLRRLQAAATQSSFSHESRGARRRGCMSEGTSGGRESRGVLSRLRG